MENVTLFENFLIWLCRNRLEFTVTTGLAYGHKMYKRGNFTFVEIDDHTVAVDGECFNYKATTLEELINLNKAMK